MLTKAPRDHRRRVSSQISHLVQPPDFDLARSWHGIGAALHPGDRLVHVLDFPEPETGDQLAGRCKRSVDDRTAGTIEPIRSPCEEGLRPSAMRMMPALTSSSLYLPIASSDWRASGVGRKPFSLSSVAFTSTIIRIVRLLALAGLIGLASERRTRSSGADIVLQIFPAGRDAGCEWPLTGAYARCWSSAAALAGWLPPRHCDGRRLPPGPWPAHRKADRALSREAHRAPACWRRSRH